MGYLDQLAQMNYQNYPGGSAGLREGEAYASMFPAWEVQSPQYPQPSPYTLLTEGYRKNELIYSLMAKRMAAISEPQMLEFQKGKKVKGKKGVDEQVEDSGLVDLLTNPNPAMSEVEFWQATQIYMDYAGFSAWEIEFNKGGDPIGLWPMSPHYCSFLRGPRQPIRAIRYQPYGLPYQDVPIEKILLFQEYDPLYPMLKGLSRTGVALRIIGVDNKSTDFLYEFFRHGAISYGLLSTEQALNDATAERIKSRWHEAHGGAENWSNIAVLGSGSKYQSIALNFKEMAFDALDGRTEARLCMVYETPAILLGAKVGLAASTYSNYEQARKGWYEETVQPRWRYYGQEVRKQLLPLWHPDEKERKQFFCGFDTTEVKALQEDRTAKWTRALDAASKNAITRDEAREEMELDPIDDKPVFIGVTVQGVATTIDVTDPTHELDEELNPEEEVPETPPALPGALPGMAQPGAPVGVPGLPGDPASQPVAPETGKEGTLGAPSGSAEAPTGTPATPPASPDKAKRPPTPPTPAEGAAKEAEAKQWRGYAKARLREGKVAKLNEFHWRFHTREEQKALVAGLVLHAPAPTPAPTPDLAQAMLAVAAELKAARMALEKAEA